VPPRRLRLDAELVRRGAARSREHASELIAAGRVTVNGGTASKPATGVTVDADIVVREDPDRPDYVSRGGHKLAGALADFAEQGLSVAGRRCLDAGASTGGFTDVLLQRGAARVIALDVGYGQLHSKIRDDPRVTVLERVNARSLTELPFAPQLVTCDVSFISVKLALPPALRLAEPGWRALVLVKPQFEAGRAETPKGVVREAAVQRRVVREVAEALVASGGEPQGVVDSGLPGPKGNREFVLHLIQREHAKLPAELDRWIADAVGQ
jgi:23S rRNA (cytidine1920-2'-O)/16S rRNA (cytidine1409-2'-O)-methyltransferase